MLKLLSTVVYLTALLSTAQAIFCDGGYTGSESVSCAEGSSAFCVSHDSNLKS